MGQSAGLGIRNFELISSHPLLSGHSIDGEFRESRRKKEAAADWGDAEKRLAAFSSQRMDDHSNRDRRDIRRHDAEALTRVVNSGRHE